MADIPKPIWTSNGQTVLYRHGDVEQIVADNAALRAELANARAVDIHSCHASCTRAGCVVAGLREERDQLRKDVAALNKIIDTRLIDAARKATP